MSDTLQGQRAVITGGARGLGRDLALAFGRAGADVAVLDRDEARLEETASMVRKLGRDCVALLVDLSRPGSIERAVGNLLDYEPYWPILVNNAGTLLSKPILELSVEDWDLLFHVNVRSAFLMSQKLAPSMMAHQGGRIIHISSIGSLMGTSGSCAYAASKAAMNQLARTMAVEWGPKGICSYALCPTVFLTDMVKEMLQDPEKKAMFDKVKERVPLGRYLTPGEVAEMAVYLATPGAEFLNGSVIPVDGGYQLNPG